MDRYRRLLERLDGWFQRGRERHPRVIPCTAGCSACCHAPFDISVADTALLAAGLRKLDATARAEVLANARRSLARAHALEPSWGTPHAVSALGEERFDALCEALHDEPCPLLDVAGNCRIYADRPLVCRLIGLSMLAEGGRRVDNCCPIQDRFPAYAALPPVEFDLGAFEEEERACMQEAATALFGDAIYEGYHTFIAAVVGEVGGEEVAGPAPHVSVSGGPRRNDE